MEGLCPTVYGDLSCQIRVESVSPAVEVWSLYLMNCKGSPKESCFEEGMAKLGTLLWIGVQPKALILQGYDREYLFLDPSQIGQKVCSQPRAFGICALSA